MIKLLCPTVGAVLLMALGLQVAATARPAAEETPGEAARATPRRPVDSLLWPSAEGRPTSSSKASSVKHFPGDRSTSAAATTENVVPPQMTASTPIARSVLEDEPPSLAVNDTDSSVVGGVKEFAVHPSRSIPPVRDLNVPTPTLIR
jgi:hypothetical protein